MPKLWNQTIEAHRRDVREAVLDATAALVAQQRLLSVTMSQIAEDAGIARATLYKYYPDVEAILAAWHARHLASHLQRLTEARDGAGNLDDQLTAVLEAYALLAHESRGHHDTELVALLHRREPVARAELKVRTLVGELLVEAAERGDVRADIPPDELASYCLHALTAATGLPSAAAVRRLVGVTLAGLRPG